MHLATPQSAILSAVIFNALIIIALIPLALRGVKLPAVGAARCSATEPADLWRRRTDRCRSSASSSIDMLLVGAPASPDQGGSMHARTDLVPRSMLLVLTLLTGVVYPLVVTRSRSSRFRAQANGSLIVRRRQGRRFDADRPAVRRSEVFLEPAVGDVAAAVQRRRLVRLEPGPAQSRARRRRQGRGSRRCATPTRATLRPCPSISSRRRRAASIRTSASAAADLPGGARRAGAGSAGGARARTGRAHIRGPHVRAPRRAARQRRSR